MTLIKTKLSGTVRVAANAGEEKALSAYSHSTLNSFTPVIPSCMEFIQCALVMPIPAWLGTKLEPAVDVELCE